MVLTTNTTESIFKHHEKNYVTGEEAVVNFTFTVKQYKLSDHACFWLLIKNHIIWYHWVGFRISLSLSREGAIFEMRLRIYFSCSHLARRDRDYHKTILVFRDENETKYCYSHVSRRDRDFRKSFLMVEREKMKLTLVENSRDREFSLTSGSRSFIEVVLLGSHEQRRQTRFDIFAIAVKTHSHGKTIFWGYFSYVLLGRKIWKLVPLFIFRH